MIEIELKYELESRLKLNLNSSSEKIVEDIYYDTSDYKLLKSGNFLRIRNNKSLDFKLNANDLSHLYCKETNFDLNDSNIDSINSILNSLGIDEKFESIIDLKSKFGVLAPIKKKRTTYNLEDSIVMSIDEVEDLGYFLEIEYDLDKDEVDDADYYKNLLIEFLKKYHIYDKLSREVHIGYVELYLKKYNIEAYKLGIYQED